MTRVSLALFVLILSAVYGCNLFKTQITLVDNDMLLWRLRTQVVLTFCSLICTVFGFFLTFCSLIRTVLVFILCVSKQKPLWIQAMS